MESNRGSWLAYQEKCRSTGTGPHAVMRLLRLSSVVNKTYRWKLFVLMGWGKNDPLISGAPLFWSWSPCGDRLAVHVGGNSRASADARVVILDALSGQTVHLVTDRPGEFRVPAWAPHDDLLAYVEQDPQGHDTLFLLDASTGEKGPVAGGEGGMAMVWSPDGNTLTFAHAASPGSSLFAPVRALDLPSGRTATLLEDPVVGFFGLRKTKRFCTSAWIADVAISAGIVCCAVLGKHLNSLVFCQVESRCLCYHFLISTRCPHPPLAPDGKTLAFAGYLINPAGAATASQVYLLSLDRDDEPQPVATGNFVCWNLTDRK